MRSPIEDRAVYFCVVVLKSGKTLFFEERVKKHAARHGDFLFFLIERERERERERQRGEQAAAKTNDALARCSFDLSFFSKKRKQTKKLSLASLLASRKHRRFVATFFDDDDNTRANHSA